VEIGSFVAILKLRLCYIAFCNTDFQCCCSKASLAKLTSE